MVAQISIPVSNVVALLGAGFTRIEVWRSVGADNEFVEITASVPASAQLFSLAANTLFRMGGHLLKVSVDGGLEQSITFDSLILFWTPSQVATQINTVVAGLASVTGNQVVLTSPTTGRASSLVITYNDADDLGFTAGETAHGLNARIVLTSGQVLYPFIDVAGAAGDKYEWRFSANGVNPISSFSAIVLGSDPPLAGVPLSIATATFIGLDGRPRQTRILVVSDGSPAAISGFVVGTDQPAIADSDTLGFMQVPLVIGAKVRVAVEGTAFVREFTVPNLAQFDLLSAMAAAPDPFTVQVPPPFLIRRSF